MVLVVRRRLFVFRGCLEGGCSRNGQIANDWLFGACQNRSVVVNPAPLLGCLWNRVSARGAWVLAGAFGVQPFSDKRASRYQTSAADSLPAMDDNILSRRK